MTTLSLQTKIYRLPTRLKPFMLGQDLAEIYEVEPKYIAQAVKRNPKRFPNDFLFQLTNDELTFLKSQNVTLHSPRANPYGFNREGANMLSAVLKSDVATERSVEIMRAFSTLEETLLNQQTELSAISIDKLKTCQQELLKARPKWKRILRYRRLGLSQRDIGKLLAVTQRCIWGHLAQMKRCGLIETTGILPLEDRAENFGNGSS